MLAQTVQALGALLIGGVFVWAGVEHFVKFKAMTAYLAARQFPAPAFLLAAGSALEIAAGSLLALGIAVAVAAGVLVVFTTAVNTLLLRFWACEGLERQTSRSAFLVNFAVIGGLLLAATV